MSVIARESDLAPIAKDWLQSHGYDIRSEVHNIDIVGRSQDGLFHAVELKKSFNVDVLSQGLRGQRWAGEATIVVPQPPGRGLSVSRKIDDWVRICRGPGSYRHLTLPTPHPVLRAAGAASFEQTSASR